MFDSCLLGIEGRAGELAVVVFDLGGSDFCSIYTRTLDEMGPWQTILLEGHKPLYSAQHRPNNRCM